VWIQVTNAVPFLLIPKARVFQISIGAIERLPGLA